MEKNTKPVRRDKTSGKKRAKTYGPIADLGSHLSPDWWRSLFGSLYLKTDGDVVCDEAITRTEVDLIQEIMRIQPHEYVLDLCCGQGRHSLELARRGSLHVHGLDRSRYLIGRAKSFAEHEGIRVKFREGDARKLPYPADMFDVVLILGNSFGYFETLDQDIMVLKEVFRVLKPFGRFLLDAADGEYVAKHYEPRSWEWIDDKRFVCRERTLDSQNNRLICREVITHVHTGVIADQVYAERLYDADHLRALLEKSGFTEVVVHESRQTESVRNQDLGMMSRRILVTASLNKNWTPVLRRKKEDLHVAVALGDPRKTDIVKPNGTLDDDDMHTIAELKSALGTISGRRWYFLDRHDRLLRDLLRLRPRLDYVFNLCDEGYWNDPLKELHVPALLDILGIPYTGSGPQCLATCYDKSRVRGIAAEMEIPVPTGFLIPPDAETIEIVLPYPVYAINVC